MNVAVAVSGGTDSLYTLATLREAFGNHHVFALHARFKEQITNDPVPALKEQCHNLNVPLHVVDLHKEFNELIIRPFVKAYADGKTPNPCVHCNAKIKFGLLQKKAQELGAHQIATGHYVSLIDHELYGKALKCGADPTKDQSYFLALTPKEQLQTAIFPLGTLRKTEVRERLQKMGLEVPLPKESQEICFVPNDDYRKFLQSSDVDLLSEGRMVMLDGTIVGKHKGLWKYTEGQRRGLGVSWSEPLYVAHKNHSCNELVLGTAKDILIDTCTAQDINFLVPQDNWPKELFVRTRYRQQAVPADIQFVTHTSSSKKITIHFHSPQLPAAPGQLAAIFDKSGYVLAGGLITNDL